jgi:hypothetical protein
MDESGRVVAFYIATKQMVGYSALMGKLFFSLQIRYKLLEPNLYIILSPFIPRPLLSHFLNICKISSN